MIFRYLKFILLNDILGHLLALIIYPFIYWTRDKVSKDKYKFIWWFFNDNVGNYGDKYFQEKFKKGDSKLQMFLLSYHWCAWRNHLQNYYNSHRIIGEPILIYSNTTCSRENISDANWRTVKYCNKVGEFKDKYGDYIDFNNSILGKQWYVFTINNKKYFRKSKTTIIKLKLINRYFINEYKFGFENYNWALQFHLKLAKIK